MSIDLIVSMALIVIIVAVVVKLHLEEKVTMRRAEEFLRSELEIANELYEKETGKPMFDIEREVSQLHINMKY